METIKPPPLIIIQNDEGKIIPKKWKMTIILIFPFFRHDFHKTLKPFFLFQDYKAKNMTEMRQSFVTDPDVHQQIANEIVQWEADLERLHCEQFRLRCYMASLQSGELPNPKVRNLFIYSEAKLWKPFTIAIKICFAELYIIIRDIISYFFHINRLPPVKVFLI